MNRKILGKSYVGARQELAKDFVLILIGACIAFVLSSSGFLDTFISLLGGHVIAAFVAGVFFTSVFTIAPASLALVHIGQSISLFELAFFGALGALLGDLLLFFFIRDRFSEDLKRSFKPSFVRHVARSFHFGFLKWLSPILGAALIASPLPDELGLALLGLSKTRVALLVPISFVMNLIGIYLLLWLASLV